MAQGRRTGWTSFMRSMAVATGFLVCTATTASGLGLRQPVKQGNLRRRAQVATVAPTTLPTTAATTAATLAAVATNATAAPTVANLTILGTPLLEVAISDVMEPTHRMAELGAQFQTVAKFAGVKTDDSIYGDIVKPYLDQEMQVVMVLEFFDQYEANLAQIVNGTYDDYVYRFIDDMIYDGNRFIWIRPLHEMNGNWYSWGTQVPGNSIDLFIQAYQHIHDMFTLKGANVKFQLAYNCISGQNDTTPFTEWYPGDEYVDMVVCSGYNRAGSDANHMTWDSFADVFRDGYEQMAALSPNLTLGVGETGCTEYAGNDKAQWFRDAFASLATEFPRVTQVTWLLQNKPGDGEWDLNSADEIEAFADCLREYTPQNAQLALYNYLPLTDINGDGIINGDDAPPPPLAIDANNNGIIDPNEELNATVAPTAAPTAAPTMV